MQAMPVLTFVVLVKVVNGSSIRIDFYTVIDRLYNILPFLKNLGCWGRNCYFERQMQIAPHSLFAGSRMKKMFVASSSGCGLHNASVSEWWSGYERRFELTVHSPSVLARFSYHIVAETIFAEAI